jgi:hypothetical protein
MYIPMLVVPVVHPVFLVELIISVTYIYESPCRSSCSHQLLTTESRFSSTAVRIRICRGKNYTVADFFLSTLFFPCQLLFLYSSLYHEGLFKAYLNMQHQGSQFHCTSQSEVLSLSVIY